MHSPTTSPPPSQSRFPAWVWACTFCAVFPLLLIVLIGVLAVPHLRDIRHTARERASSNTCLEHVQQSCQAIQLYVQDYDNHYPLAADWMANTYPYVKDQKVYQCPTVTAKDPSAYGYAYNSKLSGKATKTIKTPSLMEMVYDSSNLSYNASDPLTSLPDPARHIYRDPSSPTPNRDQMVNMIGYADGHAKATPPGSVIPRPLPR